MHWFPPWREQLQRPHQLPGTSDIQRSPGPAASAIRHPEPPLLPVVPGKGMLVNVLQLAELAKRTAWAVKGIIPEESIGFLFGPSGSYKSFLALDYAMHRCYGLDWLGKKTKQAVPVYVAAEGAGFVWKRIRAWHDFHGLDWRDCPIQLVRKAIDLNTQAHEVRRDIVATGIQPGDIIVDTLSQTLGSANENENRDVAAYLQKLGAELRDVFGSTVLIIHHTGHNSQDRMRGAAALGMNADFVFGLRQDAKFRATLKCYKQKDDEKSEPAPFLMHKRTLELDEDGEPITSLAAAHSPQVGAGSEGSKPETQRDLFMRLLAVHRDEDALRQAFDKESGITNSTTRRTAWSKQRKHAIDRGAAVFRGGECWPT